MAKNNVQCCVCGKIVSYWDEFKPMGEAHPKAICPSCLAWSNHRDAQLARIEAEHNRLYHQHSGVVVEQ